MANLTYHDVARLLKADFETGRLYWLPRAPDIFKKTAARTADHTCRWWNSRFANAEAFTSINANGYHSGKLFRRGYEAHRVIWLLAHRAWPEDQIDHINGDRSDNRLANLRAVTLAENVKNQRLRVTNNSGIMGVSWKASNGKWQARICVNGRDKYLGLFESLSDACAVRKAAEIEYGYHPNHGRV